MDANLKIDNIRKHANKSSRFIPQERRADLRPIKLSKYGNIREKVFWTLKNFIGKILIFVTEKRNLVSSDMREQNLIPYSMNTNQIKECGGNIL